jgi:hypothetical protein
MSEIKDGGPAFPKTGRVSSENRRMEDGQVGMTLRDYFAAKAMQAFLSRDVGTTEMTDAEFDTRVAGWSYDTADAMLKARSQS